MNAFVRNVVEILGKYLGNVNLNNDEIAAMLEIPPDVSMGDYGLPCFQLARTFRKAPKLIAEELSEQIKADGSVPSDLISGVESLNGYVNFFVDKCAIAKLTLAEVRQAGEKYGSSLRGKGNTVVLDFSSPNIAKRFSIGHIRSTVIGNSLYKIFSFLGYDCVRINHLGDWGTQFGKLIAAYRLWGSPEELETDPLAKLHDLYVRYNREAELDSSLDEEARKWFKKLEDGDPEAYELWEWFKDISMREFDRTYELMGIEFDSYAGESFYNDKMEATVQKLKEAGLTTTSQGALIVDLEEFDMPPCLLQKSDGATLYATRDITAALYRYDAYKFGKLIYVVGAPQSLHFRQVFKVLELMGCDWVQNCVHVPFGLIQLEEGTMSTRKGNVVFLEDVLHRAVELTREIIEEKNPQLAGKEDVARSVGIGAIVFGDLRNNRIKDIKFSWEEILNFDGETGPYVQYTHARACSVLRKAPSEFSQFDESYLTDECSFAILKDLMRFPEVIELAASGYEPSLVARYLLLLAGNFNRFYHEYRILDDDHDVMRARLALVDAVRQVMKNGLGLLGIQAPEEM